MNLKIRTALSYTIFVGFLCYHAFIDSSYRLSADDFAVTDLATQGIPGVGFALEMYLRWEGPFLGMTLLGLVCWLASVTVPWLPLLLVKGVLVLSAAQLLKAVRPLLGSNWKSAETIGMATILMSGLYLISPNQSEIWHWLVGTPYLFPIIFSLLGVAALLNERILLAIVPFAFVMQSRATYAILIFGLLFLVSGYNILNGIKRKDWSIFICATFVFLLIYLVAPGNYTRMSDHGNSLAFLVSQFRIGLHHLFVSYNVAKIDRIALAILGCFMFVGTIPRPVVPRKMWLMLIPIALYLLFAVTHEVLFVVVTGYCEWTRVLSLHSFLFMSTCVFYGFWIVAKFNLVAKRVLMLASAGSLILLVGFMLRGISQELLEAQNLRIEYDQRMNTILSHSSVGDTLYVKKVDYTGKLYFEDLSEDPDFWINKDFRKAYDLPFKVAVQKEIE
jgi:hypothetical protein